MKIIKPMKDNFSFVKCNFKSIREVIINMNNDKIVGGFGADFSNAILDVFEKHGIVYADVKFSFKNNYLSVISSDFEGNDNTNGNLYATLYANKLL